MKALWVLRETAALVRYVTDRSPRSQGNFNFTATAMLGPYGPFYPALPGIDAVLVTIEHGAGGLLEWTFRPAGE